MEWICGLSVVYLFVVNMAGFTVMGIDKRKAKRRKWRIPEKTLFTLALIGGSFGTTLGMYVFRHKTKHWYFKYGMPVIFIMQAVAGAYILQQL